MKDNTSGSSSTTTDATKLKVNVAIVGAGASGLQCGSSILSRQRQRQNNSDSNGDGDSDQAQNCYPSVLILEGRDRIGGRIFTTHETRQVATISRTTTIIVDNKQQHVKEGDEIEESPPDQIATATFPLDHGASWVHGTKDNPMMKLLQLSHKRRQQQRQHEGKNQHPSTATVPSSKPSNDDDKSTDTSDNNNGSPILNEVFVNGNPWIRPNHVLHETNEIQIYFNGKALANDSKLVKDGIRYHYYVMKKVSDHVNHLFDIGNGMETVESSLEQAIIQTTTHGDNHRNKDVDGDIIPEDNDDDDVKLLASFYRHLIECWHGIPSSELQIGCATVDQNDARRMNTAAAILPTTTTTTNSKNDDDEIRAVDVGDYVGPHCSVIHGMKDILQPLINDVVHDIYQRGQIRLNEQVVRIEHHHDIGGHSVVRLETTSGLHVESDCCIVTIPIGCLKQDTTSSRLPSSGPSNVSAPLFVPSLSDEKVEAIDKISMGAYKKVFLTFDRIFWSSREALIGLIRTCPSQSDDKNGSDSRITFNGLGNHLLINNLWAKNYNIPCLEVILSGDNGKWAIDKSVDTIRLEVLTFMQQSMAFSIDPNSRLNSNDYANAKNVFLLLDDWCIDCHVTRWEEDPMSNGAYCNFAVGTLERHMDALVEPEWGGCLLFAGDGTVADYLGSVHAALVSGQEAAQRFFDGVGCIE